MHVRLIRATGFKRFSDLTVEMPGSPRLVVMCGPNGSGKSCLLEAISIWARMQGVGGWNPDPSYLVKGGGEASGGWGNLVHVEFHESWSEKRKLVTVRSAYRNDPEFQLAELKRTGELLDDANSTAIRMIDNDARVAANYQRLVASTLMNVFDGSHDGVEVQVLRQEVMEPVRSAMQALFPGLELSGVGDPLGAGTFSFTKAGKSDFSYKNLSGGEKAGFDLVLDLAIKRGAFDDTVYCIDEPEAHMSTRTQAKLLDELLALLGPDCQLWIATHSIGMMRRAVELYGADSESVAFLDFDNRDFESSEVIRAEPPSRDFWRRQLDVALGDMAELVAPGTVVLCEGKPSSGKLTNARSEFDARCFRAMFGPQLPDVDCISVGNAGEVAEDKLGLGAAMAAFKVGTTVIRVIDRDYRSVQEIADMEAAGVRVLRRRHLEAFLLDNEVLAALCESVGKLEQLSAVVEAKDNAVADSVKRGNDVDDLKSAAGDCSVATRRILQLKQAGSTTEAFLADTLAPLVTPNMTVYQELRDDIFGPIPAATSAV
jgi:predicted ATPase